MARTMVLMLLLIGMVVVAALHLAPAEHACVSFSVTTPSLGAKDQCSPTEIPFFDVSDHSPGVCATITQTNTIVCATASFHLPV